MMNMNLNMVEDFDWITPDDWYMSDSDCESIPGPINEKKNNKRPNMFNDRDEKKFFKCNEKKIFSGNEPTVTLQSQQILQWKRIIDDDSNHYTRLVLSEKGKNVAYDGDFGFRIRANVLQQIIHPLDQKPYYTWTLETIPMFFLRIRLIQDGKGMERPVFDIGQPLPGFVWHPFPNKEEFSFGIFPHKIFTNVLKKEVTKILPRKISTISIENIRFYQRKSILDLLPSSFSYSKKKEFIFKKVLVIRFENDVDPFVLDIFEEFHKNCFGKNLKCSYEKGNVYQGIQYSEYSKIDLHLSDDHPFKKKFYFQKGNLQKILLKIAPFKQSIKGLTEPININAIAPHFMNTNIQNEVIVMKYLTENQHDQHGFPRFLDCLLDNWNLYLIASYQDGTILPSNYCIPKGIPLKKVPYEIEQRAKFIFRQIVEKISYLHQLGLSHLDISFDNIILHHNQGQPVCTLIDLERVVCQEYLPHLERFAVHRPHGKHRMNHGKYLYFCPELEDFPGNPFYCGDRYYHPMKVDIWQLGVLLYILLTGSAPFSPIIRGPSQQQEEQLPHQHSSRSVVMNYQRDWIEKIRWSGISNFELCVESSLQGTRSIPLKDFFSEEVNSLLTRMLRLDPNERIDIQAVLADPWLTEQQQQQPEQTK